MKKSKIVNLVLITAALASCHKAHRGPVAAQNRVFMRGDSTASYQQTQMYQRDDQYGNFFLWYYAFRPYGYYNNGVYYSTGYYSSAITESSNVGINSVKGGVIRGGFGDGSHGFSVSS